MSEYTTFGPFQAFMDSREQTNIHAKAYFNIKTVTSEHKLKIKQPSLCAVQQQVQHLNNNDHLGLCQSLLQTFLYMYDAVNFATRIKKVDIKKTAYIYYNGWMFVTSVMVDPSHIRIPTQV